MKLVLRYMRRDARVAYVRSRIQTGRPRTRAVRCLRRLTEAEPDLLARYLAELEAERTLLGHLDASEAQFRSEAPGLATGSVTRPVGLLLYALVRALRPETVIETGTANGVSTTYLLAGLERNGTGRLVSIDLPFSFRHGALVPLVDGTDIETDYASPIPPGREPGWIVPNELRARWELRLGDARDLLPDLLDEVGEVSLFFHDSLHVREQMLFEFEAVWRYLRAGGVLGADDVFQRRHDVFPAFARSVGYPYVTFEDAGFIRKDRAARGTSAWKPADHRLR